MKTTHLLIPDPADGGPTPSDDNPNEEASSPSSDATGESSTPSDEMSIGDMVRKAASDLPEDKSAPSTDKQEKAPEEEAPTEEEPSAESEEVKEEQPQPEKLPFSEHPRWKEVLNERDKAKEELETLRPQAEVANNLSTFCRTNNISQEQLVEGLELMALMNKDVKAFRNKIGEMVENIDVASGSKLPVDLQKKVDDGRLDPEDAKEIARLRMETRNATASSESAQQRTARLQQEGIINSLNSWEANIKKSDADYLSYKPMFEKVFSGLLASNPPKNAQDAVKLAEEARKIVRDHNAKLKPLPAKKKVLRSGGSSTNNGTRLELNDLSTESVLGAVRGLAAQHS